MKGATADPCVMTISKPNRMSVLNIGPNHHFLRTFMKAQSSDMILNLLGILLAFPYPIKRLTDSP